MGGLLETNQSYAFNRDKFKEYRATNIDPTRFSDWQKDSMYKSSYNCFHGPVPIPSPRMPTSPKTPSFPATRASSPATAPTASMPRATPSSPSNPSARTVSISIAAGSPRTALTSPKSPSLTTPRPDSPANMERPPFKKPTPIGTYLFDHSGKMDHNEQTELRRPFSSAQSSVPRVGEGS